MDERNETGRFEVSIKDKKCRISKRGIIKRWGKNYRKEPIRHNGLSWLKVKKCVGLKSKIIKFRFKETRMSTSKKITLRGKNFLTKHGRE